MEAPQKQYYQAKEFAERAGVTVRTLHFYDRIGLLCPSARTQSGYRLYDEQDLERLEQILALRFVRFELRHIKKLLSGPPQPFAVALELQREIVLQEQRRLDAALQAIERARDALQTGDAAGRREAVDHVIEALKMKDDYSWTEKYYTPDDKEKIAQTRQQLGEAGIQKAQQDWADLIAEVETAAKDGTDPASEHAQALNRRWCELVAGFTRNDPGVTTALKKLYADQPNWPATIKRPWTDEAQTFLDRVRAQSS
ncbi:MAG: MerR family transcriptional regulator [Candidatus Baltobacteraceae bacterium]